MTTILVEEDLKIQNTFKTKLDLLMYLLDEYEDVVLWNEMEELIKNSKKEDFVGYEDFIIKYKK